MSGRLTPEAPQFRDGSHYRRYDFTARRGDTLAFGLTSDDFDANLILTDRFGNPVSRNDDGGERCNARLIYVIKASGAHRLLVNSSARAELGDYRLSVTRGGGGGGSRGEPPADTSCRGFGPVAGMIRPGETVEGELTVDDPMFTGDSTYFQRWILPLAAGETVTIDLESDAFDAYLLLARGREQHFAENDDGGGGCTARLVFTAGDDRPIRIVVNTVRPHTAGRFTLRVQTGALPIEPKGECAEGEA